TVRDAPYGALQRVLVDEFQDTDPVQGEILERLTGEAFPSGRLFLVGDAKQSIYRFRGARPEIFEEFRARFPESGRLSLTENFRSVPGILDFVNALFADTFEDPDAALVPVVGPVPDHDQPVVEFLWATESEGAAKSSNSSAHDRRELEARWLARRLRQRLDAGWMVRDRQAREVRRAHPGDVAFLFRAMTDVGPYESALVEEGFDYHVLGGSAFYAQQEVHDLINVLSVIEDPLDAVALAGTLRSPFFCLSDDGLYWLSTARHDLVEGLQDADAIAQLSERDRRHACRARDLLSQWRGLKDRVAIAALVDRVLDESGYEAALLGEFLGDRKRANARKLVRLARQFDQQGGFTLAAFVARLRADLKRPPREEQAATTDEQGTSVRLMSIHQAKGLEFPIVVIPDLNRKPAADLGAVAFDPTLGPLVRRGKDRAAEPGTSATGDDTADAGSRESLGWLAYQALERHHDEREALRLFYVATTRARDALILSAGLGPSEQPKSPAMCLLEGRFDRQTGRCLASLPEGWRPPIIHVTRDVLDPAPSPSPSSGRTRTRGGRIPLFEVAEAIDRSPVAGVVTAPAAPRRPGIVDLDPAWGLAPTSARLDRLVRAILAESRAWNPRALARAATQAARWHDPLAPTSRVDEAIACLKPWIGGRIGQDVAGSEATERGVAWTITWPPDAVDSTVFRGVADLVTKDRQGELQVLLFSIAGASESRERLRLLLSARAAESLGLGRVRRGWRIRLGPGRGLSGEECFDAAAIDAAVRETLDTPSA
ncbi:MAG: UvrD-helicase domain-containing protein, partial [Planctomycetaceae bacterium]|nr:UvrD-helicase domain-containing protein [Planctomycetaceae bacterium]